MARLRIHILLLGGGGGVEVTQDTQNVWSQFKFLGCKMLKMMLVGKVVTTPAASLMPYNMVLPH
jgi:hypothetical protein